MGGFFCFAEMDAIHFCEGFSGFASRCAPGRQNPQSTKTFGFHPFCRTRRQSRNEHKGVRPLINPQGSAACGRAPALHFLFLLAGIRVSLNIDKFLPKHYNIYKYNTQGKRRSAHHPKGGVKYAGIDYCAHSCAQA